MQAARPGTSARGLRTLVTGLAAAGLLATSGCAASQASGTGSPTPTPPSNPVTSVSSGPGATAELVTGTARTSPSIAACLDAIGAQLRERTTVAANGLVTVLAGALPCRAVGLWAGRFSLDSDPSLDPTPQFGAQYTGARQIAVRLPPAAGRCSAAAVFFSVDADDGTDGSVVARTASQARSDLAGWPAGSTSVVPGGGILRGRSSPVLAGTVIGDPSTCSPGESVSSPLAVAGDCWSALPETQVTSGSAAPATGEATRFRRTTCGEMHTHEVYWAEALTPAGYVTTGRPTGLPAAAWARKRADEVCARRSTAIRLTNDVTRADIFLEYLWPATLAYPPPNPGGWSKAQIVCLARWKDGRASDRHLLHR